MTLQIRLENCESVSMKTSKLSCFVTLILVSSNVLAIASNIYAIKANDSTIEKIESIGMISSASLYKTNVKNLRAEICSGSFHNVSIGEVNLLKIVGDFTMKNVIVDSIKKNSILVENNSSLTMKNTEINLIEGSGIIVKGKLVLLNVTIKAGFETSICITPTSELYFENVVHITREVEVIGEMGNPEFRVQGDVKIEMHSVTYNNFYLNSTGAGSAIRPHIATNVCESRVTIASFLSMQKRNSKWKTSHNYYFKHLVLDRPETDEEYFGTRVSLFVSIILLSFLVILFLGCRAYRYRDGG